MISFCQNENETSINYIPLETRRDQSCRLKAHHHLLCVSLTKGLALSNLLEEEVDTGIDLEVLQILLGASQTHQETAEADVHRARNQQ